jgi:hypothetical protein
MIAIAVDRPGNVEPGLEPIGHAIGEFRSGIECVVGNEAAGKLGLFAADDGVVEVVLTGPLADIGDLAVVDLDLVIGVSRHHRCPDDSQDARNI